jgi:hypothetical protein
MRANACLRCVLKRAHVQSTERLAAILQTAGEFRSSLSIAQPTISFTQNSEYALVEIKIPGHPCGFLNATCDHRGRAAKDAGRRREARRRHNGQRLLEYACKFENHHIVAVCGVEL